MENKFTKLNKHYEIVNLDTFVKISDALIFYSFTDLPYKLKNTDNTIEYNKFIHKNFNYLNTYFPNFMNFLNDKIIEINQNHNMVNYID
jgi:hypothetical protein